MVDHATSTSFVPHQPQSICTDASRATGGLTITSPPRGPASRLRVGGAARRPGRRARACVV